MMHIFTWFSVGTAIIIVSKLLHRLAVSAHVTAVRSTHTTQCNDPSHQNHAPHCDVRERFDTGGREYRIKVPKLVLMVVVEHNNNLMLHIIMIMMMSHIMLFVGRECSTK